VRPGQAGRTGVDNGGATSMGVTKDKITVVQYIPDYGAEVNAILRAQGLFYDASAARVTNAAFQAFINKTYQLHGARSTSRPSRAPAAPSRRTCSASSPR
jgi:hypothetical protein